MHTELCSFHADGPCTCKPVYARIAGPGELSLSNGNVLPRVSEQDRYRPVQGEWPVDVSPELSGILVSVRRFSRNGQI